MIEQVPAQYQDDEPEVLTGLRAMPLNRATDPLVGHLVVGTSAAAERSFRA